MREKIAELETELQSRKERERTLSGAIKIGFWEWDEINDRPSYLSPEFASILGLSQEKLYEIYQREDDLYDFVHPEDLEQYKYHVNLLAREKNADGTAHVFDYRVIRPDGTIRHVREMEIGILENDGELTSSYGAVQDTTEYHELLIAAQKSEEKYSALFSQMPLGVLEQDYTYVKQRIDELRSAGIDNIKDYLEANGDLLKDMVTGSSITAVNDALMELYRTDSLEEFREDDADTDSWWSDEWVKFYASEIDGLLSPANLHTAELQEERFDGTFFETRMITKVLGGSRDTWDRVITMHDDVTDRKRNETALIEAKEAAEGK